MLSWCWFLKDLEKGPLKLTQISERGCVLFYGACIKEICGIARAHLRKRHWLAGVGCPGYWKMALYIWFSDFWGGGTVPCVLLIGLDGAGSGNVVTDSCHQSKIPLQVVVTESNSRQTGRAPCPFVLPFILPLMPFLTKLFRKPARNWVI